LKLQYDEILSNFAFRLNLLRYSKGAQLDVNGTVQLSLPDVCDIKLAMRATAYVGATGNDPVFAFKARNVGTMTLKVRRCRLNG